MTETERFRAGDPALFRELVRTHSSRLSGIARLYASDDDEANDLVQQSWLEIFRCRAQYSGAGSMLGWMLAVCRTQCLQHARRRAARPALEPLSDHEPERAVQSPPGDELSGYLHDAIAALTPRERDAVVLRLVEGRSTRETATAMDCAEGTVKALLHRGTCKLRESLRSRR